jgi:hypothetical protein
MDNSSMKRVHCDYNEREISRIKRRKEIFMLELEDMIDSGDVQIFDSQEAIAYEIVGAFKNRKIINVMTIAKTQSGKTGSMLATIKLYLQDSSNLIPIENIYIITGLSSIEWIEQTKERMPKCIRDRIFHRDKLASLFADEIKDKKNVLIIMDEIQIAAKNGQTLNKTFVNADLNKQKLYDNDIKIIEYTATPDGTIYDLMKWDDASKKILATVGDGYTGCYDLLMEGRVKQYKDLCGYDRTKDDDEEQDYSTAIKNIEEIKTDIEEKFASARYHIIRTPKGFEQDITIDNFKKVFDETIFDFMTYDGKSDINDINTKLKDKPDQHTFIFIKERLRCAKTLKKMYLGILYERYTSGVPDDAAIIQGLIGRDTGYDNNGVSICYTNIDTVERYIKLWMSKFDDKSIKWNSKTTKFKRGVLSASDTFNDPKFYDGFSVSSSASNSTNDKDHKLFDTQDEALKFALDNLKIKFNKTKEKAPKELCDKDGNNPTVEYLLKRMWGLDREHPARKVITSENKWCVYWRPSQISV